tara:strand:- start:309 stop:578 length:270 start_codon:yes stop_codon:yes gene_type:complete
LEQVVLVERITHLAQLVVTLSLALLQVLVEVPVALLILTQEMADQVAALQEAINQQGQVQQIKVLLVVLVEHILVPMLVAEAVALVKSV